MKEFINEIDTVSKRLCILHILSDAMVYWIENKLTDKEYHYIKGYADCKIKQLGKN